MSGKKKKRDRGLYRVAFWVVVGFMGALALLFLLRDLMGSSGDSDGLTDEEVAYVPRTLHGIPIDGLELQKKEVASGETMGKILDEWGLPGASAYALIEQSRAVFDPRLLRVGMSYTVLVDSLKGPTHLILETNPYKYVVYHLADSLYAEEGSRPVMLKQRAVSGKIETSLWDAFVGQGLNPALAVSMADVYAWTVDFFRTQHGDFFKLVYLEEWVDDTINLGPSKILAAEFNQAGQANIAVFFTDSAQYEGYFDPEGKNLKRAFLKAPLDYFRISSRYSGKRFHPVQKRWKAHLGTDYAAPTGTPIRSTAAGVVEKKGYTAGNGNYVKVKHNGTYSTQYLHMSRFAKGVNVGTRVTQGQVIGYVGSTGLATGPHVCYRFWKNGKQVDPLREKLPSAEPIKEEYKRSFQLLAQQYQVALDSLVIQP